MAFQQMFQVATADIARCHHASVADWPTLTANRIYAMLLVVRFQLSRMNKPQSALRLIRLHARKLLVRPKTRQKL